MIFLYPLNYFYYFLYYTDTLSTTTLVLVYYLSLKCSAKSGAATWLQQISLLVVSSACILARQTNAVWLLFIAGTHMLEHISVHAGFEDNELSFTRIYLFLLHLWRGKSQLLNSTWPMLLPVLGFVGFVLKTGSIVLGELDICYLMIYSIV